MAFTIKIKDSLHYVDDCITCGVVFTIPASKYEFCRENGGYFHCPNGHNQGWSESRSKREQRNKEQEQIRRERDLAIQQQAQLNDEIADLNKALKSEKAKSKKAITRIKGGVCPCCNRHFASLERHMKTKHKELGVCDVATN